MELTIVTPEREVFSESIDAVVLPGSEGDFGVLPGHERFLASLRAGEVEIRSAAAAQYAALTDGYAEVAGDRVVVMVETCELAEDIDLARAQRARDEAEGRVDAIRAGVAEDGNLHAAEAALQRASIRIQVAGKRR